MSNRFKAAVEKTLGDAIRKDDDIARDMWCALANVDWYHPESKEMASYSFRAAGGLIADIRGKGSYLDWYCSGPYATVSEFIHRSLKKEGWIYDDKPSVCDEPGCLNYVSCGWPSIDGRYRTTCTDHYDRDQSRAYQPEAKNTNDNG